MQSAVRQTNPASRLPSLPNPDTQPFDSAEQAWLWTMAALIARREGARYTANKGLVLRPCDPDDVVRCLDKLYRQGRVTLAHARVLRLWGERQLPPSPKVAAETPDYKLWVEALDRLAWPLRVKGIVG
jgi:hypothetical protein